MMHGAELALKTAMRDFLLLGLFHFRNQGAHAMWRGSGHSKMQGCLAVPCSMPYILLRAHLGKMI